MYSNGKIPLHNFEKDDFYIFFKNSLNKMLDFNAIDDLRNEPLKIVFREKKTNN